MTVPIRIRLRGRLQTESPLHLGSGDTVERRGLEIERKSPGEGSTYEAARVAAVATDHQGKPMLPGSALKGVLRAWMEAREDGAGTAARVFGSAEGAGGAAVLDGRFAGGEPEVPPPYWCPKRATGVVSRVAIDRRRRTASHQRLLHQEAVPPGVGFAVEIECEGLDDEDVTAVLAALEAFGRDRGPALGARTADGWGRMSWRLESIERLGEEEVRAWLASGAPAMVGDAYAPLAAAERDAWLAAARARGGEPAAGAAIEIGIELRFDGPFLVDDADPVRVGKGVDKPDAVPRRDHRGRVILPASSLRGALRARAERILRTLAGNGAACGPDAPRPPCAAVEELAAVAGLCPACRIFGAAGWRTAVHLGDFAAAQRVDDEDLPRQHFVAVDRFTGGAAGQRKFDVRAAVDPVLTGTLRVDVAALARAGVGGWGLALLALTLRDLAEGDVPLGAGAAHGYGACSAAVRGLDFAGTWDADAERLRDVLEPVLRPPHAAWPRDGEPAGAALAAWVDELEAVARDSRRRWEETRR